MYVSVLWGLSFGDWAARKAKGSDVGLRLIRPRMNGGA